MKLTGFLIFVFSVVPLLALPSMAFGARCTIEDYNRDVVGYVSGNVVQDNLQKTVGYRQGNVIQDAFQNTLGYVEGNTIQDLHHKAVGYVKFDAVLGADQTTLGYVLGSCDPATVGAAGLILLIKKSSGLW
jgi:outer membrane lipoprotein SlyB